MKEIEFKGEDTLSQIDLEKVREIRNLNLDSYFLKTRFSRSFADKNEFTLRQ